MMTASQDLAEKRNAPRAEVHDTFDTQSNFACRPKALASHTWRVVGTAEHSGSNKLELCNGL